MSGSINKVILVGRLGADPKAHTSERGLMVTMRLATSEGWKDKASGERREKTEWHNIVVYSEGLAKVARQYCVKGTQLYVEGQLQTRKWQDRDGAERYSTDIVLNGFGARLDILDGGKRGDDADPGLHHDSGDDWDRDAHAPRRSQSGVSPKEKATTQGGGFSKAMDDEIPFGPEWRA